MKKIQNKGQSMVEYILLVSVLGLGTLVAVKLTGDIVKTVYQRSSNELGVGGMIPGSDTLNELKLKYLSAKVDAIKLQGELSGITDTVSSGFDMNQYDSILNLTNSQGFQDKLQKQSQLAQNLQNVQSDLKNVILDSAKTGVKEGLAGWWEGRKQWFSDVVHGKKFIFEGTAEKLLSDQPKVIAPWEIATSIIGDVTGNPLADAAKATGDSIKQKLKIDEMRENANALQSDIEQYQEVLNNK